MNTKSKNDVVSVSSETLLGRMLFVYALNGVIKCLSAEEIRQFESAMLDIGWKHTATIDPARWIEAMANGRTELSDMLDGVGGFDATSTAGKLHAPNDASRPALRELNPPITGISENGKNITHYSGSVNRGVVLSVSDNHGVTTE